MTEREDVTASPYATEPMDVDRLVKEVNASLIDLHAKRLAELGTDASGLFDHYAELLGNGAILRANEVQAFKLIREVLPPFGEYAVLRAGLGELAFLLTQAGFRVVACEPNSARFEALSAGLDCLTASGIESRRRFRAVEAFVPDRAADRPLLGVATDFIFNDQLQYDAELRHGLGQFDAMLISPRLFFRVRESQLDQLTSITFLRSLGFIHITEYPQAQMVFARRPAREHAKTVSSSPASTGIVTLKRPFQPTGGHSWSSQIPEFLCGGSSKDRIAFQLFEDAAPVVAYSNANHEDIVASGGGLHAYWTDLFCFSTSDNTDPNCNGRTYTLRKVSETTLGLWPLGGCTIYDPAYEMEKPGLALICARQMGYSASPNTHTIGEHLQLIDYIRGVFDIPTELRAFCNTDFAPKPQALEAVLKDLDVILVEECSDVEVVFRGIVLNRLRLADAIVTSAETDGGANKDLAAAARRWYYDGLLKASPRREEYAAQILAQMPYRGEADELLRAIVREAAPRRIATDVFVDGLKRIGALTGKPVGVLTHTPHYMPDGRPISWPPTLHDDIMEACRANGIPVMHPCELVGRYGTQVALKEDLVHWRDDFLPIVAEAMANFASQVIAGPP